ncbi:MAG: peptidoglycan-binding protein [Myxococcales bacterium]|nr:peptidoglycan-binding protein [Myxococcales bacterium]
MMAYVVRQGDHLARLAAERGFDAAEVWNHDANRELRERRRNPQVLAPGDVIYLPEARQSRLRLTAKSQNRYQADMPTVRVDQVLTFGARPLADERYEVHGLGGEPLLRRTDREGRARFEAPAHLRHVHLYLPDQNVAALVQIGHLDPETEDQGLRDRLAHLGYLLPRGLLPPSLAGDVADPATRAREIEDALRRFQRDRELPENGAPDEATLAALLDAHGS